jgi:hypothetical protein
MWAYVFVAAIISLGWHVITTRREHARAAAVRYKAAADNLRQHYEAMEKFVTDPAAVPSAVEMLLAISDISADRKQATILAEKLCKPTAKLRATSAEDQRFFDDLTQMRTARPDLGDAFETALASGLVALFLRWPETAELMPRYAAKLTNRGVEAAIARAATVQYRSQSASKPAPLRVVAAH